MKRGIVVRFLWATVYNTELFLRSAKHETQLWSIELLMCAKAVLI